MRKILAPILVVAVPLVAQAHDGGRDLDRVYTQSNESNGNRVLAFERGFDGRLRAAGSFATGGLGTGSGLGSQGALAFADGGRYLLAVNAGSNDVSVFAVTGRGLELTDRAPTGGTTPISVTAYGDLVYALDGGGDGDVSGFVLRHGRLSPIGRRALANPAPAPAQVAFTPDGGALVVTEKNSNCVDTLPIDDDGRAGPAVCHPSPGQTPFGFAFAPDRDRRGRDRDLLIVSEAAGGAADASTVSSYLVDDEELTVVDPAVPTTETAACWIAIAGGGRFAYSTNTGSGTITGFRVGGGGRLEALDGDGVTGRTGDGSHPIDAAVGDGFLHVLAGGTDTISTFRVRGDGSLAPLGVIDGLPASAVGLVATP